VRPHRRRQSPPVPPYARAAFTGVVTSPTSRRGGVSLDTATDTAKKPFKAHLPRKGARKELDAFGHRARLLVNLEADRALAAILARYRAPGVLAVHNQRVSDVAPGSPDSGKRYDRRLGNSCD
jgi:hypothetical protein